MANEDGRDYWSGDVGQRWVDLADEIDAVFSQVTALVLDVARLTPGDSVIDIGCGSGGHTLATAERIAPTGVVFGIDISGPQIAAARDRAAGRQGIFFDEADAATADLGEHRYTAATSRFGVMFFEAPAAAFANIARAVRPGGQMVFAAWGPEAENPFWTLPKKFAAEVLGAQTDGPVGKTGPLAFSDAERVTTIFDEAGLAGAQVVPMQVPVTHPGGAEGLAAMQVKLGAAAHALRVAEAGDDQRSALRDAMAKAFSFYETPNGLAVPAVLNVITVPVG